jgi:hypothetical protein
MPWKYNSRTIRAGRAWSNDEGIQHPRNWMIWSDEEKTAAGLVWEDDPAPFDSRFYWGRDADGDLIERSLVDINEVDEDDNPILDENGDQVVTLGLKSVWKQTIKEQAASMLAPTDWMVVKAAEVADYSVPSATLTARAAIRSASNTIEAAIDDAADLDAFIALFDAPEDGNAPINDWPEEE